MKKWIVLLLLALMVGCSEEQLALTESAQIGKHYIEESGYTVVSFEGEQSVTFTKEQMTEPPYMQFWSVQTIDPDAYFDKPLTQVSFLVEDHPLANMFESDKTKLTLLLSGDEVIGGTSFPHSKDPLIGSSYSIDGKTADDMHEDYMQWLKEWHEKYATK